MSPYSWQAELGWEPQAKGTPTPRPNGDRPPGPADPDNDPHPHDPPNGD